MRNTDSGSGDRNAAASAAPSLPFADHQGVLKGVSILGHSEAGE